jgi:predicted ATPase
MTSRPPTISVTIIGGCLGAGKTTLLNALLRGDHGLRLAIPERLWQHQHRR